MKGLVDGHTQKTFRSDAYKYNFSKTTGYFVRWGKTIDDDPLWSPVGPEIADIEISRNGCPKIGGANCRYCYKSNTSAPPENMSLDTFKIILSKLGPQLTQVAFGISGVYTNPDFLPMMRHCRANGIIPNFTLSGADLDDEFLSQLPGLVGAVAVSYHGDNELCFNTVRRLLDAGIEQTNIHLVTDDAERVIDFIFSLAEQMNGNGLKPNALVLLALKPKGRAKNLNNINDEAFAWIVGAARALGIPLGFDSCSAHRAMRVFEPKFHNMIEPCESGLFSAYVDTDGFFHPCSFSEDEWGKGIDVVGCGDFMQEVWLNPRVVEWRERLIAGERRCPLF